MKVRHTVAELVALVENEVDDDGLISALTLAQIPITRPRQRGENDSRTEIYVIGNTCECTDREFFDWWMRQILKGDGDEYDVLGSTHRLRMRMLLIATLEYVRGLPLTHWRDPRVKKEEDAAA